MPDHGESRVDFVLTYEYNQRSFTVDTGAIRKELDGVPINRPEVLRYIEDMIRVSMKELKED